MIPLQGSGFGLGSLACPGRKGHREATAASTPTGTSCRRITSTTIDMPIVEGRAFLRVGSRRRAVGRDHQRNVRAPGVAGPVGDRPHASAAPGRRPKSGRCRSSASRATRSTATSAAPTRRSSTCRWRSSRKPSIEFYIRHAPGRAGRHRRSGRRWRRSNRTCRL